MFGKRYRDRLIIQKEAGLYRNPLKVAAREGKYLHDGDGRRLLSFASNDYLGLAASDQWRKRVANNFAKYAPSSSSSRLVSGNYALIGEAEREYAAFFGYGDALFFPSGYQANIAVISTLFEKGDTLFFDKRIHNSSVKGMIQSGAAYHGYNHNSMPHLARKLEQHAGKQAAVLTESLFSMDGDFLKVREFQSLRERYGFLSIVDEAHAFGAIGEQGRGLAQGAADVAVGTFGKALGLFGAFVLLPPEWKDYMMNFASPLIYSTTLPEAHAASAIELLEIIAAGDDRRRRLRDVSRFMQESLAGAGFKTAGDAHIIAVEIGEEKRTAAVADGLRRAGVFVLPARYPTAPQGRAILRVSMTALHTGEDVERFVRELLPLFP
ncbi:MAG: pyridoxal phosphate-dependent aminotransferase family protein [Syntrophales bacterium]|nr:pyridoxal phosphate-dependent aminotransferase family protein [Syntrophales bacterium]